MKGVNNGVGHWLVKYGVCENISKNWCARAELNDQTIENLKVSFE